MSDKKPVVIIGAGPGGLASAMLLASAGYRVMVLERQDRVGGRTSTIGGAGFQFDLGPTFFLDPRVLEAIFAAVGRDLRDEVKLVRLDPQYRLVFGAGGELKATQTSKKCNTPLPRYPRLTRSSSRGFWPTTESRWTNFARFWIRPFKAGVTS
jgi:phytoene desaturase